MELLWRTFSVLHLIITVLSSPGVRLSPATFNVSMVTEADLESKIYLYFMNQICNKTLSLLQLSSRSAVRIAPWSSKYPPSTTTCVVGVESHAYQNYRLVVTFKTVNMSPANTLGVCEYSKLELYNARTTSSFDEMTGKNGICGNHASKKEYVTTSNFVNLRYITKDLHKHTYQYFEAVITPFHTGGCRYDEFMCKNGRCILDILECDGYNNCGDDSDEKNCSALALSIAAIIGIVVGIVLLVSIILAIVLCKCCCNACGYEKI